MIVSDSHKSEVHEPHGQKTTSPEHGEERKAESKGISFTCRRAKVLLDLDTVVYLWRSRFLMSFRLLMLIKNCGVLVTHMSEGHVHKATTLSGHEEKKQEELTGISLYCSCSCS